MAWKRKIPYLCTQKKNRFEMISSSQESYLGTASSASSFEDPQPLNADGATSTCFMVRVHGRRMFLKHVREEYADNQRYQDAFRKEFEVGYNLDHPNIVRYYEMGRDNLGSYILQEYVDGCSLTEFLAANPDYFTKEENMRKFVVQLFSALEHIHAHQTLHLDIKPDNLLITRIGHDVKVVDSGFCYTDEFQDTAGSTAAFASPEVLAKTHTYDQRSDIYSAGAVILYICKRTDRVSKKYRRFASRCMAELPEERFQNAREALDSLDKLSSTRLWMALSLALVVLAGLGIGTVALQANTEEDTLAVPEMNTPKTSYFTNHYNEYPEDTPEDVVDASMDSVFTRIYVNVMYLWADGGVRNTLAGMTDEERAHALVEAEKLLNSLPELQQHELSYLLMMFPHHRVYIYQNYRNHLHQAPADSLAKWMELARE